MTNPETMKGAGRTVTLQDYQRRMLRVLVHIQQHLDDSLTEPDELLTDIYAPLVGRMESRSAKGAKEQTSKVHE